MFTASLHTHQLFAIIFLLLVPLPFVTFIKWRKQTELTSAPFWRKLIRLTNIFLVIVLITGIYIYPYFTSIRLWIAVILSLAVGGLLGVISKQLKQYNMRVELSAKMIHLKQISIFGCIYVVVLIILFGYMAHFYQF